MPLRCVGPLYTDGKPFRLCSRRLGAGPRRDTTNVKSRRSCVSRAREDCNERKTEVRRACPEEQSAGTQKIPWNVLNDDPPGHAVYRECIRPGGIDFYSQMQARLGYVVMCVTLTLEIRCRQS